mmetsp:Transcript_48204/g.134537  ORF Transcript_48204/g.134537 Transcript_48204/m.134537 type:complete len:212 (+) Transcript_48204:205-840(+)
MGHARARRPAEGAAAAVGLSIYAVSGYADACASQQHVSATNAVPSQWVRILGREPIGCHAKKLRPLYEPLVRLLEGSLHNRRHVTDWQGRGRYYAYRRGGREQGLHSGDERVRVHDKVGNIRRQALALLQLLVCHAIPVATARVDELSGRSEPASVGRRAADVARVDGLRDLWREARRVWQRPISHGCQTRLRHLPAAHAGRTGVRHPSGL